MSKGELKESSLDDLNRIREEAMVWEAKDDEGKMFSPWKEAMDGLQKFQETGAVGHLEGARNCIDILIEHFGEKTEK